MTQPWFTFPEIGPIAFSFGPFAVRWYALAYIGGLLFAFAYMKRLVSNPALWGGKPASVSVAQLDDLFVWGVLGVILGGRLGYVLFYEPLVFLHDPLQAFAIWQGGMSFHGGFLGVVVACVVFARRHGLRVDRLLDLGGASVPVGLGLGRVANFINGELYGRTSDVPWAIVFPGAGPLARHPSQLYEAALEGLALFAAARIATHVFGSLRYPGMTAGVFAFGYAASRIIVEHFREPDVQLGYLAGPLTMGMLLSVPLGLVGIWLLVRARKVQA
ncbi:MAG: prolipoprotein diacylglyceryl transferase [Aestuariivirgaceae bacterium]|nr:prolipoprotein diacylglyceryl transferase [Aestuariivirgaceae bacterium]